MKNQRNEKSGKVFNYRITENGFISHKTLAAAYKVSPGTFKRELLKIPGLTLYRYKKLYTPKEVKIIFFHLGAP